MDSFHLDPPAGFRGLQSGLPVTKYERHLPHWRQVGATYFVTSRLADALPQQKLGFLRRLRAEWERAHPVPRSEQDWEEYARRFTQQVERWLDEGYGECHFNERCYVEDLVERIKHFHGSRYFLSCFVIMPNHFHLVIAPFGEHRLEELLGAMKGVNARHINQSLGRNGKLWEEESYDRIVRDAEHLWRVVQYVGRNPRLAGRHDESDWRRWIHPDWVASGWDFCD